MSAIGGIFLFLAFIVLAITGGFITDCARRIANIPGYDANSKLKAAHSKATWAAVITWIIVALVLFLGLFYYFYLSKKVQGFGKIVTYILLAICMISVIIVGILSAITAADINQAGVPDNGGSYTQAIIATVTGIIGFVLLLIGFFLIVYKSPKKQTGEKKETPAELLAEIGSQADSSQPSLPSWAEGLPEVTDSGTGIGSLSDKINDIYSSNPDLVSNIRNIMNHPQVQGIIRHPRVQNFFSSLGQNQGLQQAYQNFMYR